MPNRIIKESICESEMLAECSIFAQDLFKRLITYADDYGRFNSDPVIMRARLYARELDFITEDDILEGLSELCGAGKIVFYTPQIFNQFGKKGIYGAFPNWAEHQRVRDGKKKCPEPSDTSVNDWYLRRFIPMRMKEEVLERAGFKCSVCGKFLTSSKDAHRFLKLGTGLVHFDHIVPVVQGGRATLENIRATCPECNLKRKRYLDFKDLLSETICSQKSAASCGELRQVAASCGELPRDAETCGELRPESESESESNPNPNPKESTRTRFTPPTIHDVAEYCQERQNSVDPQQFVDFYASKGWRVGNQPMRDWRAAVRTWERRDAGTKRQDHKHGADRLLDMIERGDFDEP